MLLLHFASSAEGWCYHPHLHFILLYSLMHACDRHTLKEQWWTWRKQTAVIYNQFTYKYFDIYSGKGYFVYVQIIKIIQSYYYH